MGTASEGGVKAEGEASSKVEASVEASSTRPEHSSDKREVPRFESRLAHHGITYGWREALGLPTCPYVIRWRLETPWGSIRLHHWLSNDDPRYKHDHAWNFVTFVLKGGYVDSSPEGDEHLRAPAVRYRSAEHQHTVFPDEGGAWTVIVTGPKVRPWGFWVNNKLLKANRYFRRYGHHPCD